MEINSQVAALEARVSRNETDIGKIIESLTATREAASELTANMQQLDHSIKDATLTLYGNGNRQNSLVTIADTLVIECNNIQQEVERLREISDTAQSAAAKAISAADDAVKLVSEFKNETEGSIVQIGKLKLTGKAANIAAILIVPIGVIAVIMCLVYFILAASGYAPWPWSG
jgi:chromosome segregation ATPase